MGHSQLSAQSWHRRFNRQRALKQDRFLLIDILLEQLSTPSKPYIEKTLPVFARSPSIASDCRPDPRRFAGELLVACMSATLTRLQLRDRQVCAPEILQFGYQSHACVQPKTAFGLVLRCPANADRVHLPTLST